MLTGIYDLGFWPAQRTLLLTSTHGFSTRAAQATAADFRRLSPDAPAVTNQSLEGSRLPTTNPWTLVSILGSEEARLRAGLHPPPKLPVHISCRQLSRRLSDARMREKELNRAGEQARTRRRAGTQAAVSSPHCASAGTDATRCVAGSSRRVVGRACGCRRVCNTHPSPARAD